MSGQNGLSREEAEEVYRRYGHLLLRRCRAVMRDDAAADDALQECFVKIIRYGKAYRAAETKLGWLYQVVDNCCYDAFRRRAPRAAPEVADQVDEPRAGCPTTRILAERALRRLPTGERRIALLAFVDGVSQGEIAAEVGASRQTVNKKLAAIRGRLRRWLGAN